MDTRTKPCIFVSASGGEGSAEYGRRWPWFRVGRPKTARLGLLMMSSASPHRRAIRGPSASVELPMANEPCLDVLVGAPPSTHRPHRRLPNAAILAGSAPNRRLCVTVDASLASSAPVAKACNDDSTVPGQALRPCSCPHPRAVSARQRPIQPRTMLDIQPLTRVGAE